MAISFAGSAGGPNTSGNLTISFSALLDESGGTPTLQEGDLVLVSVIKRTTTTDPPTVESAGYAAVYSSIHANDDNDTNLCTFYKFMGATPDSDVTITGAGFSNTGSYCVHVLRGVDQTTPFDGVTPATAAGANGVQPDPPSVTPSSSGAWVMAVGAGGGPNTDAAILPLTNPANMDSTANHFAFGDNRRATIAGALFSTWSSGAFDPAAFGGGGSDASSSWAASAFVLKPASGATGVSGSLAAQETGSDTLGAIGAVTIAGALDAQETGADAFAGSGTVADAETITGALEARETGTDSASIIGAVAVRGSLSASETGNDTLAASGSVAVAGTLAAVEIGADTLAVAGVIAIQGTLEARETGADAFAASGTVATLAEIAGTLTARETGVDAFRARAWRDNAYLRARRRREGGFSDYGIWRASR